MRLKDIKVGDTIEYRTGGVYVNSGIPATRGGIVRQKAGYNIELEDGNWLYWHDIKDKNVRIVKDENEHLSKL